MPRGLFLKTLKDNFKTILIWSISLILIVFMYTLIYPSISSQNQINDIFKSLPPALQAIEGSVGEITTPNGYIGSEYLSLTFPIMLGILAILIGSSLINKEEESGTIELILARPVKRLQIYYQKFWGLVVAITIVGLSGWLGMFLSQSLIKINLVNFFWATLSGILLSLVIASIAYAITGITNKKSISTAIATFVLVASYLVDTLVKISDKLKGIDKISLFHYYDADNILKNGPHYSAYLIPIVLIIIFLFIGAISFNKRDIRV